MNHFEEELLAVDTTAERCAGCGEDGVLYGTDDGRLLCHECLGEEDFVEGEYLNPKPSDIFDPSRMQEDPIPKPGATEKASRGGQLGGACRNIYGRHGKPDTSLWTPPWQKDYPKTTTQEST